MVSTRLPFPSPPVPLVIGIIVSCMFHNFFQIPSKVEVLILLFSFFQFYSVVGRDSKVDNFAISLFFLLIIFRSGLLAEIMWSVCMSKSHRSLCVSFSRADAGLCIYHLFVWSNLNFLHISQCITLPTQSCLVLYSFFANLLQSLIIIILIIIITGSLAKWVECSQMIRETAVQSQVESYQRLKKMVLDTSLLNTQHYKVRIKGRVEQYRERSCALPYSSV